MKIKTLIAAFIFLSSCFFGNNSFSFEIDNDKFKEVHNELEKLKLENAALKQENQLLRKLVFERQNAAEHQKINTPTTPSSSIPTPTQSTPSPNPSAVQKNAPSRPSSAAEYWITSSSGKRHNSGCRFFGTSKGRPGGATEGTPCKICGG